MSSLKRLTSLAIVSNGSSARTIPVSITTLLSKIARRSWANS